MTKSQLIYQLSALASVMEKSEEEVFNVLAAYKEGLALLEQVEDEIILGGTLTGSNEAQRKAQLREKTSEERMGLLRLEQALEQAKMRLRQRQIEFRALRTIAMLVSGSDKDEEIENGA